MPDTHRSAPARVSRALSQPPTAAPAPASADAVEDGCMSIREACTFTGLSRSHLYDSMDHGRLRFVKMGRRRLIPRRALVQWLADNVVG